MLVKKQKQRASSKELKDSFISLENTNSNENFNYNVRDQTVLI
jgi:hypothetical protein